MWWELGWHSWEPEGPLGGWLCHVARRLVLVLSGKLSSGFGSWSSGLGLLVLLESMLVGFHEREQPKRTKET